MTGKENILIVDDDREIRESLHKLLKQEGYNVLLSANGQEVHQVLADSRVDVLLLDIMLPGEDGFEICKKLRQEMRDFPIIMITAKDQEIDRVVGLEIGADDYVVKPFSSRELLARIKAVLRRVHPHDAELVTGVYAFSGWQYDPYRMELQSPEAVVVPLSSSENNLLHAFVMNPQVPLSRDKLLDLTKGVNNVQFDRTIDYHVSRLRRKLKDDPRKPEIIKTNWGSGYIFTCNVESR